MQHSPVRFIINCPNQDHLASGLIEVTYKQFHKDLLILEKLTNLNTLKLLTK